MSNKIAVVAKKLYDVELFFEGESVLVLKLAVIDIKEILRYLAKYKCELLYDSVSVSLNDEIEVILCKG